MQVKSLTTGLAETVASHSRAIFIAVLLAAIIHIIATLSAPELVGDTPVGRLAKVAPLHKFAVLPPVSPQAQPLPFMAPDVRYAMCRYETARGPVTVTAQLPGAGWTLSLYTKEGDNFYTAVGKEGQTSEISLQLIPVADRFLGLTPEARGKMSEATSILDIATGSGIAVLRGPDRGLAYRADTEAILRKASCTAHPF